MPHGLRTLPASELMRLELKAREAGCPHAARACRDELTRRCDLRAELPEINRESVA